MVNIISVAAVVVDLKYYLSAALLTNILAFCLQTNHFFADELNCKLEFDVTVEELQTAL